LERGVVMAGPEQGGRATGQCNQPGRERERNGVWEQVLSGKRVETDVRKSRRPSGTAFGSSVGTNIDER